MKKVLIITYYWPPSGGPGVQRVLKFAKYLPEFGWQPVILTVEKGNFPSYDNTLLKEIPADCKVYKTKAFEPFELYKSLTGKSEGEKIPTFVLSNKEKESLLEKISKWMRANVFVPDAKIGWVKYIVQSGMKIIEEEKPDLIFSSSPPHSLQIGVMQLARKSGVKWVADFRDPWSTAFWQKDISRLKFAVNKDLKFEKKVLSSADHIVAVGKQIADSFNSIAENNYTVIHNGFDETDFVLSDKISGGSENKSDKFKITYTGTLGESQRISNFISALKNLDDEIRSRIEVNFYGTFHQSVLKQLNKLNYVNFFNSVPHKEAVRLMSESQLLLLIIPDCPDNKGILTGKLFEYMATRNYILGIGPVDGEAANILKKTGCGRMYDYNDDLLEVIKEQFANWEKGVDPKLNEDHLISYSRKNLTAKLASIFGDLS